MRDRFDRDLKAIISCGVLFFAAANALGAQNLRNDYFVHQFWAEVEPTPGGVFSLSGANPNAPSPPAGAANAATGSPTGALSAGQTTGNQAPASGTASPATSAPSGQGPAGGPASPPAGPSGGAAATGPPSGGNAAGGGKTGAPVSIPQKDVAITEILKEAQFVFSGMIYGFSFSYTPADTTRRIAGSFELKPIAQIKWGDPHLRVLDTRIDGSRIVARVMYSLVPYQERWKEGWDSNVYPTAMGRGTSRYYLSYNQKMASYRDAIKEAIRDYLRQRIYNKPKLVVGELVLRGSPYTIIDAGRYVTTLTVKLRIDKVQPYSVY